MSNRTPTAGSVLTAIALTSIIASAAHAGLTVTLADFSRIRADRVTIDGSSASIESDATPLPPDKKLPLSELLAVEFDSAAATPTTRPTDVFALATRDGAVVVGVPAGLADDALRWRSRLLGEWSVPVQSIRSLAAADVADATGRQLGEPQATQDELRLRNGDGLAGVLSAATNASVTVQSAGGETVSVDWSAVRSVRFADTATAASTPAAHAFQIGLRDGTRVGVDGVTLSMGRETSPVLAANWNGQKVTIDASELTRLDHLNGRTRPLAALTPTRTTYAPYFPRLAPSVGDGRDGSAIATANGATSAMSAPPRSTMTWAVPADVAGGTLHARYLIPAGLARADVTIRVRADDRVAFERVHVRAGEPGAPIDVPLAGAKSVTLEVDYGDNYDAQDEFYWLDAAMVGAAK